MSLMRAKLRVASVTKSHEPGATTGSESLSFHGVAASSYPADGSDENNTFAKFSPSVSLSITITNPALFDQFEVGQEFYADFTPAPKKAVADSV